ncbi:MAG: TIGR02594 family protein [Chlorobi bacterium]|nr:TIGR02594 family protein [Chlorobiota bacterium]
MPFPPLQLHDGFTGYTPTPYIPDVRARVRELQQSLAAKGYKPGAADGLFGVKTRAAVIEAQTALGFDPSGVVFEQFWIGLSGGDAKQKVSAFDRAPWMTRAYHYLGTKEKQGAADEALIVYFHGHTTLDASDDEVPWCSSFENTIMAESGLPTTRSAAAVSWAKYGQNVNRDDVRFGDIVIMKRTGGHHVCNFVQAKGGGKFLAIGGNQSDAVTETTFGWDRVIAIRRPDGF